MLLEVRSMASLRAHRSLVVAATVIAGSGTIIGGTACRERASAEQNVADESPARHYTPSIVTPAAAEVRLETSGDRMIRQELNTAIAQDPLLKDRAIRFTIDNGDITVTGTVRTETERQRINALAMQINGVKSVANALRVLPS